MKKLLTIGWLLCTLNAIAQVPQLINYQGVARDNVGNPVANATIALRLSLLENTPTGTEIYRESFLNVVTNRFGLFNIRIGGGTVESGNFSTIDWTRNSKWLKTAIDMGGSGSNFVAAGTPSQFVAVPFALMAQKAMVASNMSIHDLTDVDTIGRSVGQFLGWDGTQWKPMILPSGNSYTSGTGIQMANGIISNTGDLSNTNEIQSLSMSGNTLSLSNGGGNVTLPTGITYTAGTGVQLSNGIISNTGDLSNTNEIQSLSMSGNTLSLSNGGGNVTLPTGTTYTAGTGIGINNGVISNTAPNQTVALTAGAGIQVTGTHPNFTITNTTSPIPVISSTSYNTVALNSASLIKVEGTVVFSSDFSRLSSAVSPVILGGGTFEGSGTQVISVPNNTTFKNIKFKNITIEGSSILFENCTFEGTCPKLGWDANFISCSFNSMTTGSLSRLGFIQNSKLSSCTIPRVAGILGSELSDCTIGNGDLNQNQMSRLMDNSYIGTSTIYLLQADCIVSGNKFSNSKLQVGSLNSTPNFVSINNNVFNNIKTGETEAINLNMANPAYKRWLIHNNIFFMQNTTPQSLQLSNSDGSPTGLAVVSIMGNAFMKGVRSIFYNSNARALIQNNSTQETSLGVGGSSGNLQVGTNFSF